MRRTYRRVRRRSDVGNSELLVTINDVRSSTLLKGRISVKAEREQGSNRKSNGKTNSKAQAEEYNKAIFLVLFIASTLSTTFGILRA